MKSVTSRSLAVLSVCLLALTAAPRLAAAEDKPGIVFDFGGQEPVLPPTNLDPKYTTAGLRAAFTAMCKRLDYRIVKLEIDPSEFPFLVSAVIEGRCEYRVLRGELSSMDGYAYSGSVTRWNGSVTSVALNMVPADAYPHAQAVSIQQRLMARLQKLVGPPPRR